MTPTARAAALLALALLAGCSTYDPVALRADEEFRTIQPLDGRARAYRVLVVPVVEDRPARDEELELRGPMRFDARAFEGELTKALAQAFGAGSSAQPQVSVADSEADPALQAFSSGYDLVVEARIKRWDATFLGTNGWWYPNAFFLAWYFWPIGPHWVIADEAYGVDCELSLDVFSASSERSLPLHDRQREIVVRSELDAEVERGELPPGPVLELSDLQRGLDLLGTWILGDLDDDQWEAVGGLIEPYARRYSAVRAATAVRDAVAAFEARKDEEKVELLAATHALVIGVSTYEVPCAHADTDAQNFARLLTGALPALPPAARGAEPLDADPSPEGRKRRRWAPEKNVVTLINGQASRAAIKSALQTLAERAQPQDRLVVYFAGRGRRLRGKKTWLEALALQPDSGEAISLAWLSELIQAIPAKRRLVVLDADFHPGERGLGKKATRSPRDLAAHLKGGLLRGASGGAVVVGTTLAPGEQVQSYEEQGLLTRYLVRGLQGAADADGDGLSYADLADYLERQVLNLSEVALPRPQRPLVASPAPGHKIR